MAADYDLGMLRVFVLVHETRSVTATAEQLFLSQPSVSYTLRKLRKHFNDPLFQRRGNRLEPTPMAEGLYPPLKSLLESMDQAMAGASRFDPSSSTRRFRLRMTDVGVSGLLPTILKDMRQVAPSVMLDVEALNLSTAVDELRSGQAEAVICTTRLDEPDVRRDMLFEQAYVGLCSADHPRIQGDPDLATWQAEDHVGVATSTGHRALDLRAQELEIVRRVPLVIPNFVALPHLLEDSEMVSYAPAGMAARLLGRHRIATFHLPIEVPVTEVALYTLRREFPSPALEWLRRTLVKTLQAPR